MNFLFTESVTHNTFLGNINELMYQYHQTDYLTQERGQEYYSKLIYTLNPLKNRYILFSEKSMYNNSDFLTQLNDKNVTFLQ